MSIKLDGSSTRRRKDTETLTSQYSYYRKTGRIPQFKRAGRRRKDIPEEERNIVKKLYGIYRSNACYLQQILSAHGYKINHNRIRRILVQEGFALIEEVDKV